MLSRLSQWAQDAMASTNELQEELDSLGQALDTMRCSKTDGQRVERRAQEIENRLAFRATRNRFLGLNQA